MGVGLDLGIEILFWFTLLLSVVNSLRYDVIFTATTSKSRVNITYEDLRKYFVEYNRHMPSILDTHYEKWANAKGADCEECLLVANLFNQAIDSAKTGLHFMSQLITLTAPGFKS